MFLSAMSPPGNPKTIQYLIPGRATNVEFLKQVKNWQSPSQDPWSNCLINSRETTKCQTNYYSGRQKDKSKTICRPLGYLGARVKTICTAELSAIITALATVLRACSKPPELDFLSDSVFSIKVLQKQCRASYNVELAHPVRESARG